MPTISDDASTRAGVEEPAAPASAASPTGGLEEAEPTFPPELIVGLRAPDRAAARIIGDMTPEQARLGAVVTFGISPSGRHAERAAASGATENPARPNVLSLPHPRLSPLPTRVCTSRPGSPSDHDPSP